MHLYLDLLTEGEYLYDYKGNEFLGANDAYDFAETTVEVLKNELDGAWSGWSVEVRNAEGRKLFSLPICALEPNTAISPNDPGPIAASPIEQTAPADRPRSLLNIEDVIVHSAVICSIAGNLGYSASKAHSYEEACNALSARLFDCITLDLGLGKRAGLDVLHHLSTIRCSAKFIVVSQSDKDTCDDVVQLGRDLGLNVSDAVQKPIDILLLRKILSQAQGAISGAEI
jgi:CheY-like chemotaxis protein